MPRPAIFISAVSSELRSARQLVANTLQFLGYDAIWQDIFGTEQGDLRGMLRRKVDGSAGVVQLVGRRYGFEPPAPDAEFGRVSYTQYEAIYARQRGKKVWYLFLDDGFPADPCAPEPEEKQQLQRTYEARVKAEGQLRHHIASDAALEAIVLKLRDDLAHLRRRGQQWAAAVLALLVLLAAGLAWMKLGQARQEHEIHGVAEQNSALLSQNEKLLAALRELPQAVAQSSQAGQKDDDATRLARAYAALDEKLKLPAGTLEKELPPFATQLLARADTSAMDRARAFFARRQFADAEKAALEAKEKALAAGLPAGEVVAALELAGNAAREQSQSARALEHFRAAAALTSEERNPREWADVQMNIGTALDDHGEYAAAEAVDRKVVEVRGRILGTEDPETLVSRRKLAESLENEGRYAEAEKEIRAVLASEQRTLGAEHPETLAGRVLLADVIEDQGNLPEAEKEYRAALDAQQRVLGAENPATLKNRHDLAVVLAHEGRYADAEAEDRAVLEIRERVLGPEHRDTLKSRNNLAVMLDNQGKHAEAEKEYRTVLETQQRVLGAEHPDTLGSRINLAGSLSDQGRFAEAEQEYRAVLAIQQRVLGPEHPDTLLTRMGLAVSLDNQRKYPDAEKEYRATLTIRERVLGAEHPDTLTSRAGLANALYGQGKYAESEEEYREVLAIQERVLGPEHPSSLLTAYNLIEALKAQKKYPEALELARRTEAGYIKTYGAANKDTQDMVQLRQSLEAAGGK